MEEGHEIADVDIKKEVSEVVEKLGKEDLLKYTHSEVIRKVKSGEDKEGKFLFDAYKEALSETQQ